MIEETTTETATSDTKKSPASCVKFTKEEHQEISQDSKLSGQSIPALLKLAYFSGRKVSVVMPKEEQERWYKELRSWGNNLNQLAKRVNSGLTAGWYTEFETIRNSLQRIENFVLGVYGSR